MIYVPCARVKPNIVDHFLFLFMFWLSAFPCLTIPVDSSLLCGCWLIAVPASTKWNVCDFFSGCIFSVCEK
jgi:hypothetical protein